MSTIVTELYDALRAAGVPDDKARAAATPELYLANRTELATKRDLAELKGELIKWNAGLLVAMTAVFAAIVKLL